MDQFCQVLLTNPNFGSDEVESSIVALSQPVIGVQNPEMDKPIHSENSNINTKEILQVLECEDAKQPANQPVMDIPLPIPSSNTTRSRSITIKDPLLKLPSSNDAKPPLVQGMRDPSLHTASTRAGNKIAINFIKLPTVTIKDNATVHQVPHFVINQSTLIGSPANSLCLPMQPEGIFQQCVNTSFSSSSMVCPSFVPQIQQPTYINLSSATPIMVVPKEPPPQYPKTHEINCGIHNVTSSAVGMYVVPPPPPYPNNSLSNCGIYVTSNLANNSSTSTAPAIAKSTVPSRHPPNASSYSNNSLSNCFVSVMGNSAVATSTVPLLHPPNALSSSYGTIVKLSRETTSSTASLINNNLIIRVADDTSTSTVSSSLQNTRDINTNLQRVTPPSAAPYIIACLAPPPPYRQASLNNCGIDVKVAKDPPTSTTSPSVCGVSSTSLSNRNIGTSVTGNTPAPFASRGNCDQSVKTACTSPSSTPVMGMHYALPKAYQNVSLNSKGTQASIPTNILHSKSPSISISPGPISSCPTASLYTPDIKIEPSDETQTSEAAKRCKIFDMFELSKPMKNEIDDFPTEELTVEIDPSNYLDSSDVDFPEKLFPPYEIGERDCTTYQPTSTTDQHLVENVHNASKSNFSPHSLKAASSSEVLICPEDTFEALNDQFQTHKNPQQIANVTKPKGSEAPKATQYKMRYLPRIKGLDRTFSPYNIKTANLSSSPNTISSDIKFQANNIHDQLTNSPEMMSGFAKPLFCKVITPFTNSTENDSLGTDQNKYLCIAPEVYSEHFDSPYQTNTANLPSVPQAISDVKSQANSVQNQLDKSPKMMSGIDKPLVANVAKPAVAKLTETIVVKLTNQFVTIASKQFTNFTDNSPRTAQNQYQHIAPKEMMSGIDKPLVANVAKPAVAKLTNQFVTIAPKQFTNFTDNSPRTAQNQYQHIASKEMMSGIDKPLVANVAKPAVAKLTEPIVAKLTNQFVTIAPKQFTNFTDNSPRTSQNQYQHIAPKADLEHCSSYQINATKLASLQAIPNNKSEANNVPNELTSSLRAISSIAKPLDNSWNNVLKSLLNNPQRKMISKQASSPVGLERANSSLKIRSVGLSESKLDINPRQVEPLHNANAFEKICNSDNEGSADSYLFTEQRHSPAVVPETSQVPSAPERPVVSMILDAKMNSSGVISHEQFNPQSCSTDVQGKGRPTQNVTLQIPSVSGIQHPHLSRYFKNSSGVKSVEQFNHQTCINSGVEIAGTEIVSSPQPTLFYESHKTEGLSEPGRPFWYLHVIGSSVKINRPKEAVVKPLEIPNFYDEEHCYSIRCRTLLKGVKISDKCATKFPELLKKSVAVSANKFPEMSQRRCRVVLKRLNAAHFEGLTVNLRKVSEQDLFSPVRQSNRLIKKECILSNDWRRSSRIKERKFRLKNNLRPSSTLKKECNLKNNLRPSSRLKEKTFHPMENSRKTSKSPRIKEEIMSPRATLKKPTVKDAATSPCPSPFCDYESLTLDADPDIVELMKRELKVKLEVLENLSHSHK